MYDMTIQLRTDGGKCLYLQIYEHIRQEIREGKLLAGERLPSTRSLAEYLQVARSTVDYAYDQLLSEGYIEAVPYRGYFVCPIEELLHLEEENKVVGARSPVLPEKEASERKYAYDFSPHGIDMSGFPFGVWKKITKNILNDGNSELFALGESPGDYDLRCTIGRYLHSSRGVNCTPEQIVIGAGNDYLLMLFQQILGRNMHIAMESLTYKRAYRIFHALGYEIVTAESDKNGMQISALENENACAAYVMPSHQFPTGSVMPVGRRNELLRWAAKGEERYIIEDDYDSEFRYRGKPIPSLQSSDKHGKVIYIGTFSKAIAPAIRIGYMVLPLPLLERYHRECSFYSCTVSRIDQRILNEFIRDGYFERHLNKMRKLYRAKHDLLLECLKELEGSFVISGEDAGLHLLLTARDAKWSEDKLIQRAAGADVKVYGISDSLVGFSPAKATVLLGFGGLSEKDIIEGTKRLTEAWAG
ncbi:MAG: PLP-dependent aminotransferase family protein [Lachnoclostridium sp.]|nr:PLP-dependent aminotransferase family protein [Lachnospira sp.]MCM1248950.1 PLP-dependent aminotransferase family protein [Lachnoclostridium sp.]